MTAVIAVAIVVFALPTVDDRETSVDSGSGPAGGQVTVPSEPQNAGTAGGLVDDTVGSRESSQTAVGNGPAAPSALNGAPAGGASAPARAGFDLGVGSPEAHSAPNCDPNTGRLKVPRMVAPPCTRPWPPEADNGGATWQGVTADSVKVVALFRRDETGNSPCIDRFKANAAVFAHAYHFWGRRVKVEFVEVPGAISMQPEEAMQRALAVEVASRQPFAVWNDTSCGTGLVFDQEMTKRGIPHWGNAAHAEQLNAMAPYSWSYSSDEFATSAEVAELVGKQLAGGVAQYAGDATMHVQERKFVVLRPKWLHRTYFDQELAKYPGATESIIADVTFTAHTGNAALSDPARSQEEAPLVAAKLKASGANNVIAFADPIFMIALTKAATSNRYFPEWTMTGFKVQDIELLSRTYDQSQWSNAFGRLQWTPSLESQNRATEHHRFYLWYWGNVDNFDANIWMDIEPFFIALHMAGPNLTPTSIRDGAFSFPAAGGFACQCVSMHQHSWGPIGLGYDDYMGMEGLGLGYYSPTTVGTDSGFGLAPAPGLNRRLYGGKWLKPGEIPTDEGPYFDDTRSLGPLNELPPSDRHPDYPCEGCPSSGGEPVKVD